MLFDEVIGNSGEIESLYDYLGVDKTFVGKSICDVVNASGQGRRPSDLIIDYLKEYYEEPVARLGALIDKDLSETTRCKKSDIAFQLRSNSVAECVNRSCIAQEQS